MTSCRWAVATLFLTVLCHKDLSAEPNQSSSNSEQKKEKTFFESAAESIASTIIYPSGHWDGSNLFAQQCHRFLLTWDRFRAKHGNSAAMYEVGRAIYFGLGTTPNEVEGLRWLLKAAEKGDPLARYTLAAIGFCHYAASPVIPGQPFVIKSYTNLPEDIRKTFTEPQCRIWLREVVQTGYSKALLLRAFVPETDDLKGDNDLKNKLLWLEKAQVAGDPYAEICRREVLGYEAPKNTFIFPDFVWRPSGTP